MGSAPGQKAQRNRFEAVAKTVAGVGCLKGFRRNTFDVAGAVQEAFSSEMQGGQGADSLRGAAFWSIRSSRFAKIDRQIER